MGLYKHDSFYRITFPVGEGMFFDMDVLGLTEEGAYDILHMNNCSYEGVREYAKGFHNTPLRLYARP